MYRHHRFIIGYVVLTVTVCAGHEVVRVEHGFSRAVARVACNDRSTANKLLKGMTDEEVVGQGLAFLAQNTDLSSEVRKYCFEVLAKRGAAKTAEGYDLFVLGLRDLSVRRWAVAGLATVPEDRRRETVDHLLSAARAPDEPDSMSVLVSALGILERWGRTAEAALPLVEDVVRDPQQSDQSRTLAVQTMLSIGSVTDVMQQFRPEDRAIVLGPLFSVGGKTHGQFDGADSTKETARTYVRNALQDEDKEVRKLALLALPAVYGEDSIVGSGDEGFWANPHLVAAIEFVAKSDPDAELRKKASFWLETLDQRVRNAIRARERRAKSPD